jgi:hypothetical protein
VAVGELFSDLSIRRPQPAGNDDDDDFIVAEMIGLGAPAPIEDFEDVGLAPAVLENVGYEFPTLLQSFSIPVVMAGRDLLVVSSAMSTGKSASICLPVVSRLLQTGPGQRIGIPMPRTVILASTIERATAVRILQVLSFSLFTLKIQLGSISNCLMHFRLFSTHSHFLPVS